MNNGIYVTPWTPRRVKKYYLDDRRRGTNMQKLAFEMLERGYQIICVYSKGLNMPTLPLRNPNGLYDAMDILDNYLFHQHYLFSRHGFSSRWDVACVDMSHPDAFIFAYK